MKLICEECGWLGQDSEMLKAPSPFDPEHTIVGCPRCREVETLVVACDEPGCSAKVTCGTPTPDGYRNTCGKHAPWRKP
jgi:hypothetical protein